MAEDSPQPTADVGVSYTDDAVVISVQGQSAALSVDEAEEFARQVVEAAARASGQDPEENDWVRIPMQYIRVAAERLDDAPGPTEGQADDETPDTGNAKTAEIHCWIKGQTQRNAMHVAAGWIAEHGWFIVEVIEHETVTSESFEGGEYLKYYEQALTDSEVFLYEIDEEETDETEGSADAS
jgi:hypothetical protein